MWPYFVLVLLAFGVYYNALENGFVSDDDFQLLSRATGGTELRMLFRLDDVPAEPQSWRGSVSSAATPA